MVPSNLTRGLQQKHIHCIKQNCTYFQSTSSLHKFALMIKTMFSGGSSVQIWTIFFVLMKVFLSSLSEGHLVSAFVLTRTVLVCNHARKLLLGAATHLSLIVAMAEALLLCILLLEVAQLLAIDSASSCLPLVSPNVFATLCSCSTSHHRTGAPSPRTEVGSLRTKKN